MEKIHSIASLIEPEARKPIQWSHTEINQNLPTQKHHNQSKNRLTMDSTYIRLSSISASMCLVIILSFPINAYYIVLKLLSIGSSSVPLIAQMMSPARTLKRCHFPPTKIEKGEIFVESERETKDWCVFDTKVRQRIRGDMNQSKRSSPNSEKKLVSWW